MKKNVLTILGVLGVIAFLGLIFMPREKLKEINLPFISNDKSEGGKNSKGEMTFISDSLPKDYKNGYFYIKDNNTQENIMYFDYGSKKEVYLCNKPNCKHDSDSCSSYSDYASANSLFYYNDSLYFLNGSADGVSVSITADGVVNDTAGSPTTIYKMNLDGTEKQKLFTAPSGTKMDMPLVIKGNMLYGYLEKSKMDKDKGNSFTTTVTERKLIKVDLSTGKYEELTNGLHESIIGTYDNKLVLQEIDYIKDPNSFDDNTKRVVYEKQTTDAKNKGISNCPLCAIGNDNNKDRIWELKEMDADHVTAWSKGGSTNIDNCQMLCQTHNRAKGNR